MQTPTMLIGIGCLNGMTDDHWVQHRTLNSHILFWSFLLLPPAPPPLVVFFLNTLWPFLVQNRVMITSLEAQQLWFQQDSVSFLCVLPMALLLTSLIKRKKRHQAEWLSLLSF